MSLFIDQGIFNVRQCNYLQLSNSQFERLIEDVYDEVDRREAENASILHYSKGQGHTTLNSTPFLPVHPELSSSRNQGRQKLGRLTDKEFNAFIYDILHEAKRRDTTFSSASGKYQVFAFLPI